MDYKNTTNVAKIFACLLIATIVVETISAAPLLDDTTAASTEKLQRIKNAKNLLKSKKNQKNQKSLMTTPAPTVFEEKDEEMWHNPCNAIGWERTQEINKSEAEQNFDAAYKNIKQSVLNVKQFLKLQNNINTTDIIAWEKFHNESYSFLPTRPSKGGLPSDPYFRKTKKELGIARKWHHDTQVYVASFVLIYRAQLQEDIIQNNNSMSQELKDIMDRARELLCDIEHFVNATSNKDTLKPPRWIPKENMTRHVTFELTENKTKLNNLFVKARFEEYIRRLYTRVLKINLTKNMEEKSLRPAKPATPSKKPRNHRKGHKGTRRFRTTTEPYTGPSTIESATKQPKVHIVRTMKPGRKQKATKIPGQKRRQHEKKNNNNNRKVKNTEPNE